MIPLLDLKAQYRTIKSELDAAVLGVLKKSSPGIAAPPKPLA